MHCGWGFTGLESGVLMIRKKVWNALSDAIRPRVWWRVKTTESSVRSCAVMTADADVYIMSAFMRITESRASDRRWWKRALRL